MNKTVKILLTIIVLIVATPIMEVAKQVPILKLILLAGMVGAFYAIWKKDKVDDKQDDEDNHQLDKS